jgi:hypothetical protein
VAPGPAALRRVAAVAADEEARAAARVEAVELKAGAVGLRAGVVRRQQRPQSRRPNYPMANRI